MSRLQENEASSIAATVAPKICAAVILSPCSARSSSCPPGCGARRCRARAEPVRVRHLPTENRAPLKVKAICLPFVFVKQPNGQHQTIDVRLASLVRLERGYAKTVWKSMRCRR